MLLSEQYRAEQARLHAAGNYGTASLQYGQMVSQLVGRREAIESVGQAAEFELWLFVAACRALRSH